MGERVVKWLQLRVTSTDLAVLRVILEARRMESQLLADTVMRGARSGTMGHSSATGARRAYLRLVREAEDLLVVLDHAKVSGDV